MHVHTRRLPMSGALIVEPVPADISTHFEYLWHLVLRPGESIDAHWRVVADGYIDVAMRVPLTLEVFDAALRSGESPRAAATLRDAIMAADMVVCGAALASRLMPMPGAILVTGMRFRHGYAVGLLRASPSDLMDGSTPLRAVIGPCALSLSHTDLPSIVPAAPHTGDTVQTTLQQAVESVIRSASRARLESIARHLIGDAHIAAAIAPVDPRLRSAMRMLDRRLRRDDATIDGLAVRVASAARSLGMSVRTLERLFADQLGMSARTYQRLGRVGVVAQWLERDAAHARAGTRQGNVVTLSALAQNVGYADHAHMTREFVGAMGLPPSSFRREALETQIHRLFGPVQFERGVPVGTVTRTAALAERD